jgi:hypothetical protein
MLKIELLLFPEIDYNVNCWNKSSLTISINFTSTLNGKQDCQMSRKKWMKFFDISNHLETYFYQSVLLLLIILKYDVPSIVHLEVQS